MMPLRSLCAALAVPFSPAAPAALAALACVLQASSAGCAPAPTYNWNAESALGYRIGPGDALKVVVWKHDELSTQAAVRPDGAISLPLVGDVPATGRSAAEIASDIQVRLHRYFQDDPPVTVQVQEVKSYKIYIVGEVNKPGEYAPSHEVTVLMGLSLAGGFTRFATADRIVIVRRDARGERRIPFDYAAVVEHGDLEQNIALELGDTVIVP
jgi:polysaccharide export outer membrane protein